MRPEKPSRWDSIRPTVTHYPRRRAAERLGRRLIPACRRNSPGFGYSTFLLAYRSMLEEVRRRPHMQFLFRGTFSCGPSLAVSHCSQKEEDASFLSQFAELENVTIYGGGALEKRYPFYSDRIEQFERAW